MANNKTSPSTLFTLIGLLLVIAGLGGGYKWLVPGLVDAKTRLESSRAKNEGMKADIKDLQVAQQKIELAKAELLASGVDIGLASKVVPATEDMPSLYIQMEDIIKFPGVSKATYQLGTPADDKGSVKIPVTVTAQGKYADLKSFINRLQTNIRPISLNTIAFTSPGAGSNELVLNASGFFRAQALSSAYTATK